MGQVFENGQVFTTPYGGRLVYMLETTPLIVHLKDADQVQKGKRWSQVMYLYYLLGYKMDAKRMRSYTTGHALREAMGDHLSLIVYNRVF